MKTKSILLLATALLGVGCVCFLAILERNKRNPAWAHIVSETHRRIKILKEKPYNDLLRDSDVYLNLLNLRKGFEEKGLDHIKPTIVVPAWHGSVTDVLGVILSAQQWLEDYKITVFDLGLSSKELQKVIITLVWFSFQRFILFASPTC